MKKIFTLVAVATAMSFAACTGSTGSANTEADSLAVEESTEITVDQLVETVQSGDAEATAKAVETAKAELEQIIATGDVEKAAAYASQIQAFVENNAEKLQNLDINTMTLQQIINTVKNIPTAAEGIANDAADAVKADAEAAKDAAIEAAQAKADEAKEAAQAKANEAVEAGKAKANEAVQNAANKANEAVNNAINDAASKLKLK